MKVTKTNLDGVVLIEPAIYKDHRGFFLESFNRQRYNEIGIKFDFIQDNISKSKRGTVRGLHYQIPPKAQGKLCHVVEGKILDVVVDIRFNSATFGKYFSQILDSENKIQIWIPPGFAHGFSVLSEEAIFFYKCTESYSKENERSILYNDPELNIDWKVDNPIVSEKDLQAPLFKDIKRDFVFKPE